MIHYFLMAVLAGPSLLPFPHMEQGSAYSVPPTRQSIVAIHRQFQPVAQVLMSGGRVSFESKEACQTFAASELKGFGGAHLLCRSEEGSK